MKKPTRLAPAAAVVAAAIVAAVAVAATQQADLTYTPQKESQLTNIDVLRQWIANYYGDPAKTGVFSQDGNYANEARSVAEDGAHWLDAKSKPKKHDTQTKAIVLDVDDTTLATWNYEIVSNWAYNPTTNATYVLGQQFPAVPGMVEMANAAAAEGYAIFYLTGRPTAQEPATLGNLTVDGIGIDAGYPAPTTLDDGEDGLFTKPATNAYPDYLRQACSGEIAAGKSCTTIHYKSATRAHIESLGYEIVANFGDQFSDLEGGYADRTFKLPNPNYYLP